MDKWTSGQAIYVKVFIHVYIYFVYIREIACPLVHHPRIIAIIKTTQATDKQRTSKIACPFKWITPPVFIG